MGTKVLDSVIDFEIRDVIKNLNEISFVQTIDSCSGWSSENKVSDGINRFWINYPYVEMISLDDIKFIDFIKYILKNINFNKTLDNNPLDLENYNLKLSNFNITNNNNILINVSLTCKGDDLSFKININDYESTSDDIQNIWNFLNSIIQEYKIINMEE